MNSNAHSPIRPAFHTPNSKNKVNSNFFATTHRPNDSKHDAKNVDVELDIHFDRIPQTLHLIKKDTGVLRTEISF